MHTIEVVLGLLVAVVVLVTLARRLQVPYPIPLVLGGLVLGFVPHLPRVQMDPDLVLLVFLPPLLYAESLNLSWRDFRANLRTIGLLAIGLVLVTTLIVAVVAHRLVPGLSWAAAFVLGAVLAPTDEVAAAAIAQRLRVPRRIIDVIEGESLVNDAVSLVVYRLAVAAVVAGTFSLAGAGRQFFLASFGGLAIGLTAGWLIGWVRRLMRGDALVENTISLLTPFAAYLPAEALHVSGVLAVVAAGLYLGRQGPRFVSSRTRLQAGSLWAMIDFLLNSLLFVLVGLQLRSILAALSGWSPLRLAEIAAAVSLTVIAARILWVYPAAYLPRFLSARLRRRDPYPPWQQVMIVAWTGIRGALSLAAALAIPLRTGTGQPFPQRPLLIFLTFATILATLVLQGLSLPALIRALGVVDDGKEAHEEAKARMQAARAALVRLEALAVEEALPADLVDDLRGHLTRRATRFTARYGGEADGDQEDHAAAYQRLMGQLLETERRVVVELRDRGVVSDDVLRRVQRDLDLEETRLQAPLE